MRKFIWFMAAVYVFILTEAAISSYGTTSLARPIGSTSDQIMKLARDAMPRDVYVTTTSTELTQAKSSVPYNTLWIHTSTDTTASLYYKSPTGRIFTVTMTLVE